MVLTCAISFTSCELDGETKTKTEYVEVQPESRTQNTRSVTSQYGELKINAGSETLSSHITPWSGWWYPLRERELFYNPNGDSPLEKYDNYVNNRYNKSSDARYYEETMIYNEREATWSGLCHAWAVASVLYKEPKTGTSMHGVDFTVGDKKALLIKSYENVNLKPIIFGERNDGGDHDPMDIYPDQFHRFVTKWLGEEKKPFLMDYDPSYPVWTVPVYNVKFDIKEESPTVMNVVAWVTLASPHVRDRNYVGTKHSVKKYTYNLIGEYNGNTFKVTDGEWTEGSITDHPDYVIAYPENVERSTFNKELNLEVIDEITGVKKI